MEVDEQSEAGGEGGKNEEEGEAEVEEEEIGGGGRERGEEIGVETWGSARRFYLEERGEREEEVKERGE